MSDIHWSLPPKEFSAAKGQFMELYGSTAVMNTYLRIAVLCLCVVCAGLTILNVKIYHGFRHVKPLVIRINEVGRAEAMRYASLEYRPQEGEIKYFLIQFVQQHYSRMRATAKDNYARSLYFLDGRLADAVMEADKKAKGMEQFLAGHGEEIDIRVQNVAIEDLRSAPYRATVDFEKVYLTADRQEIRREKYVGNFVFVVKDQVPNAWMGVALLDFAILWV